MTIKALEYIHTLLVLDEAARKENYDNARKLQYEYENSVVRDEKLVRMQTLCADAYMREHLESLSVLQEFEATEW